MNIDELTNKIVSEGFIPIRVKPFATERDFEFVGDLDGFLKAAKAMKTEVVFIAGTVFYEFEFQYEFDEDYEDNEDDDAVISENEAVYLPAVMPSLEKFKKYIGQFAYFRLHAKTASNTLMFIFAQDWILEFRKMKQEAIEKIERSRQR